MSFIARITPKTVIIGIQIALGILLVKQAVPMLQTSWILALVSLVIIFFLRGNPRAPAAVVLLFLGVLVMILHGKSAQIDIAFHLPHISTFTPMEMWDALVRAGFAQIMLTATNAVLVTVALIKKYWPEKQITERKLAMSMGMMNLVSPFFGGMPMCHGAGGLVGQYYFGARTGGTNIIEGIMELSLGLFFASSIVVLFTLFPGAIIGAMMFLVGFEMISFARDARFNTGLIPLAITLITALVFNMAVGFICGIAVHHILVKLKFITGQRA